MADPTEEIEELLNFLLPFAEERLSKDGEFHPYAAMVSTDGELSSVTAATGADPEVADLLVALHEELRAQAADGSIRASGIAADVTLTDPDSGETTDAVQIELDHADGDPVDVYVPYETAADGVKFGAPVSAGGREPVFTPAAG